ncbi:hypothetical protein BJV82DRAFT_661971 [Fennellomyces sp. T-0311]|nr:hypothetical protein BJV82DRAFT_661971 [Fennellomyces sp. T-0311]
MTDKDVTGQNIRSSLDFWGSNAGTVPLFLHLMFHTFHRTALSTFVDLFARGVDPVQPGLHRIPIQLFHRYDFFAGTWDEATLQAYNQFINSFQPPDSVEELSQLVTVARCGFGAADFCLCIAKQHPENLKYDPAVQQLKCDEIYWTLCTFFALQEAVCNALPTFPANNAAVEEWLIDVKQVYDRTAEQSGLVGILGDIKQQVADADADAINFSARMTAARSRTGAPTELSEPRRGAPLVFEGEPHSPDRVA